MSILKQNDTHKAIKENGQIKLYRKGMEKDAIAPNGEVAFDDEFINMFPDMFKDEFLRCVAHEDDLFSVFEDIEETSRILLAEANGEF